MVKVEFSKTGSPTIKENLSKDELIKLFSEIESCIDVDFTCYSENKVDGFDFRLRNGKFLSIGIGYDIMLGDCEHYIYSCVSDKDPRIWKKEQELKYQRMRENNG